MKIIDAHMHLSKIESFHQTAEELSVVDYTPNGIKDEYREANVCIGIGMGLTETDKIGFPDKHAQTPMGLDMDERPPNIVYCAGVNPHDLDSKAMDRLRSEVLKPEVVGLKIYLGYYPYYAYDEVYDPIYALAKEYSLPIVFHTGDTYSERGLLKYAHPLTLDEVAVMHREINFVMAHFGDPWTLDGAEVVYKNHNVFADLSGLVVGQGEDIKRYKDSPRFFNHLLHALTFTDNYSKFMFGTDWPLVPVKPYIDFIKSIIPKKHHEDVFYNTALKVFPKLKPFL